jgi:hypothetical protein
MLILVQNSIYSLSFLKKKRPITPAAEGGGDIKFLIFY